jgi:hypothetical protein
MLLFAIRSGRSQEAVGVASEPISKAGSPLGGVRGQVTRLASGIAQTALCRDPFINSGRSAMIRNKLSNCGCDLCSPVGVGRKAAPLE